MKITIRRFHREPDFTIGKIDIDGSQMGFTLEDAIREIQGQDVLRWKRAGVTAIPAGVYPVHITTSARFGRPLPLLIGVPGFTGVRIHPGNTSADTDGCILVGATWGGGDFIANSRTAFNAIYALILGAWSRGEPITLDIS